MIFKGSFGWHPYKKRIRYTLIFIYRISTACEKGGTNQEIKDKDLKEID